MCGCADVLVLRKVSRSLGRSVPGDLGSRALTAVPGVRCLDGDDVVAGLGF